MKLIHLELSKVSHLWLIEVLSEMSSNVPVRRQTWSLLKNYKNGLSSNFMKMMAVYFNVNTLWKITMSIEKEPFPHQLSSQQQQTKKAHKNGIKALESLFYPLFVLKN